MPRKTMIGSVRLQEGKKKAPSSNSLEGASEEIG
jgi:hypothetical protein